MEDKLSIIIPVYNTSLLIKKLLDELNKQLNSYPETEIIVIDDGSTENMDFLDNYSKMTIIHKKNGGVSSARNIGLKKATGKYITFIDSDDFVEPNYLHLIYTYMRQGYDYCVLNWYFTDNKHTQGIHHVETFLFNWAVWGYVYKREIIGDILFDTTLNVAEDIEWLRKVIGETNNYTQFVIPEPIYHYNINNEKSLTHLFNAGKIPKEREKRSS